MNIEKAYNPWKQIERAERLLSSEPQPSLQKTIYSIIFSLAIKNKDAVRAIKYGELILKDEPESVLTLANLAKVYAEQKIDLKKADAYSQKALDLSKAFQILPEPPGSIPRSTFEGMIPQDIQKNLYDSKRITILDARAFVLSTLDNDMEAEALLQESLRIYPSAEIYAQLEKVLRKQGRAAEAEKVVAAGEALRRKELQAV